MKVGDVVKLIVEPEVDWMFKYLDKTFRVLDFPTETGVEVMMIVRAQSGCGLSEKPIWR